jgi:hypothetical protein
MSQRPPLTSAELDDLARRKRAGASHASVAQELGCARETVRKHWQTLRRERSPRPRGRPPSGILSSYPDELCQMAVDLKRTHPHWGPLNVQLELAKDPRWKAQGLPSRSRLAALFKAKCPEAVQPHCLPPPLAPALPRVEQAHHRWQVDAKEKICLGDGHIASQLEITDPVSAIRLGSQAWEVTLTADTYRKLTLREIQASLRIAFTTWGCPAEVQTDHEDVYAGAHHGDYPTPFTLWLVGLGIRHVLSRDRRPTDQGAIERAHRILGELSWKDNPPRDLADLQQQLDGARVRYNLEYPSQAADCHGLPPLLTHPEAVYSGRPYQLQSEWETFNLELVDAYLTNLRWVRHADRNGTVFLGNAPYYLGKDNRQQAVHIRFLPEGRRFRFENEAGGMLKTLAAQGISRWDLTGLQPAPLKSGRVLQLSLPWVGV